MEKDICVVVDMINGFMNEGPLADHRMARIIPKIQSTLDVFLEDGKDVLSLQDAHSIDALEFDDYPPHCLKGSLESELVEELRKYENHMIKIEKNTTNGFFAEGFQTYLNQNPTLSSVTIVGCCTDICVLQFAQTLKTHSQTQGKSIDVLVVKDAVDTYHSSTHDQELFHNQALQLMKNAGIKLI